MLIISVLGIYPIPVYRGACPIVRRCGLSSDTYLPMGSQTSARLINRFQTSMPYQTSGLQGP